MKVVTATGLLLLLAAPSVALSAEDQSLRHDMSEPHALSADRGGGGPGVPSPRMTTSAAKETSTSQAADTSSSKHAAHGLTAPSPPDDHAADRLFDRRSMEDARNELRRDQGGGTFSMILLNVAEYQARKDGSFYRWDGEGWWGGDLNRLVIKSEGRGGFDGPTENAEVQALYSRAVSPYFDLQTGIRHDFEPNPSRSYATLALEGLMPYWFEVEASAFLSNKGDLLGRFDAYYDQMLTQRLVIQPRVEINLAAQDVPENDIGSGLSDVELGLRLRYEVLRELAPYLGVSYERKIGDTADYARDEGEEAETLSFVLGVRAWF
jgi:copper resistance protein B